MNKYSLLFLFLILFSCKNYESISIDDYDCILITKGHKNYLNKKTLKLDDPKKILELKNLLKDLSPRNDILIGSNPKYVLSNDCEENGIEKPNIFIRKNLISINQQRYESKENLEVYLDELFEKEGM